MPLVDLSMVEQRYDAVREVPDGAASKTPPPATAQTAGPFIAGWCATPLRGSPPSPTAAPSPIAARTRWRPRSKPASSSCAGHTRAGSENDPQQAQARA